MTSFSPVVEVVVSVGEVYPVTKNCISDTFCLFYPVVEIVVSVGEVYPVTKKLYFRYNFLCSPTAVMIQILILSNFLILFDKISAYDFLFNIRIERYWFQVHINFPMKQ